MNDFIQINQNVFLEYQNIDDDPCVTEKLKSLLDKYGCFHDYSAFNSYTKTKKNTHHSNYHGNNHHHNYHKEPIQHRKKFENAKQSSTDREITALLNKISKQNHDKIVEKIIRLTTSNNMNSIVFGILEKCYKQPCFIDVYINIILSLCCKSNCETRELIHTQLSDYTTAFIDGNEFNTFKLNSMNYDQFCKNMLNKNEILGKHKTVIAVILKILRSNIDDYFKNTFDQIIQMDEVFIKDDFERHELLLDIMTDFVKTDNKYKEHIENYYKKHINKLESYTKKAKFKILNMTTINICI